MIDVGDTPVELGEVVTVLGGDGGDVITLAQLAAWAGESQYVVLTGLGRRLPRVAAP